MSSQMDQVAIIGIAIRFPGASDCHQYWANLRAGTESISRLSDQQLNDAGVAEEQRGKASYVPAKGILNGIADFDAEFFGYSQREAARVDPQQRILLECSVEALDRAGYGNPNDRGVTGVFAGSGFNQYLYLQLWDSPSNALERASGLLGNAPDYIAPRIAYQLDLTGPSISVQTACSTSLVAVHLASNSLLEGECDLALAGAGCVRVPHTAGYDYVEGGILARDGHCRPFDSAASGTVNGCGAAILVLKRMDQALKDGDPIRAVILGSAVNNDGSQKLGFTAPNVNAQANVIADALAVANIDRDSVSFVEAHGTGTRMGDAIELEALERVFGSSRSAGDLRIGSVKGNLGHLDAAAGMASLVKVVLALENGEIPPTLHFCEPAEDSALLKGTMRVNTGLEAWESSRRRAGISSFGFGGTNAHVVLEQAPIASPDQLLADDSWQAICLSARTPQALEEMARELAQTLSQRPDVRLADLAFTLQRGRREFPHRRVVLSESVTHAIAQLADLEPTGAGAAGCPSKLQEVASRWVRGEEVEWLPTAGGRRVEMPSYPFQKHRCWYSEKSPESDRRQPVLPSVSMGDQTAKDCVQLPLWRRTGPPVSSPLVGRYVFLHRGDEWSLQIEKGIGQAGAAIDHVADGFDFSDPAGYEELLDQWVESDRIPTAIVHCAALSRASGKTSANSNVLSALENSFTGLLLLAKSLAPRREYRNTRLEIITSGTQDVVGGDCIDPYSATVAGPRLVIGQEITGQRCRQIDIDRRAMDQLVAEISSPVSDSLVALRGGHRWSATIGPVGDCLDGAPDWSGWQRDGVYVITGGLGGVAAEIAQTLRRETGGRIVLLSRRQHPPGREAGGALVEIDRDAVYFRRCDVCEPTDLAAALDVTVQRFGHIDGVIHAAGLPGGGLFLDRTLEQAEGVLRPKVLGTVNLLDALGDLKSSARPSFVLLCSSVTAIRGGHGQIDYAAANAFQDATAEARVGEVPRVISVAWDRWNGVGMAGDAASPNPKDGPPVDFGRWSWLASEHTIQHRPILPGVAFLGLCLEQLRSSGDLRNLAQVTFLRPYELSEEGKLFRRSEPQTGGRLLSFLSQTKGAARARPCIARSSCPTGRRKNSRCSSTPAGVSYLRRLRLFRTRMTISGRDWKRSG